MNEEVMSMEKQCLRLIDSPRKTASFLGGRPFVGQNIDWPYRHDEPLSFIAQLDLSELNHDKIISWLPDSGRILFFYDLEDLGGWAVIYENGTQPLFNLPMPEDIDPEHIVPSIKYVSPMCSYSYPHPQRVRTSDIGYSGTGYDYTEYYDYIQDKFGERPKHQVGGYPNPIQSDFMEKECQLASGGVDCGDSKRASSDLAKKLKREKNDWRLLFQFDSDDDIKVMWGDLGMLYFWIRERDAKSLDFSNSWMILQCY